MNKKYLIVVYMLCILLISCNLCGCTMNNPTDKSDIKILGGDIVRYSICLEKDKVELMSFPIISTKKIENLDIVSVHNSIKDNEKIKLESYEFDSKEFYEHNNYYTYFLLVKFSCSDEAVDAYVDYFMLNVDGEEHKYEIPYFRITNTQSLFGENGYSMDDGSLKISGDFTGLYGYVSDELRKSDLVLCCDKDITLKDYKLLDYLDIYACTINKIDCESDKIDMSFEKNKDISFEYAVNLKENVSENNIIKSSQIITYESEGELFYWVYTSGYYIWKDYEEFGNINAYIDEL